MDTKYKVSIVKNMAIKGVILGAFTGGWIGLFMADSEWALTPAIISLVLAIIVTYINWIVSKEDFNRKIINVIWFGVGAAIFFLVISSCIGGSTFIGELADAISESPTGTGATDKLFHATVDPILFELIGALAGSIIFLILGLIIGLFMKSSTYE